jgi:diguanylate cyclase (GGDEF)-like protein
MPRGLRLYLICLHASCLVLLMYQTVQALRGTTSSHDGRTLLAVLAFLVLSTVCEHTWLQIRGEVWQNLGTAAHVASIFLFAPPLPMLMALAASVMSQLDRRGTPLTKRAFNVTKPVMAVGLTGLISTVFFHPIDLVHQSFPVAFPDMALVVALFYVFDVGIMIGLMSLLGNGSPLQIWKQTFRHTLLPEMGSASIGVLAAIIWSYNALALVLLVAPVAAMRAAFKANARAEERAEALRRRGGQLEAVLALGQRLRLQLSRADLLQATADTARTILNAETVTGYLRDEEDPDLLRRRALAPAEATCQGPPELAVAQCAVPTSTTELRVPIEPDGKGVAGMLLVSGISQAIGSADRDVLAILTTQAAIALQNAYLHERALALAAHDNLTDLLNRRAIRTRLDEEVARANRGGRPTSLLMIDIDDFSAINDRYGHVSGDMVLRFAARALAQSVRTMDVVARYGGDEFVALLPETTIEQGFEIATRVLDAIAVLCIVEGPVSIRFTASIGVAALPEHGTSAEELLRAGDQAAYAAKHAGKGRVARPEDVVIALDHDPAVLAEQLAHANMATVAALAAAVDAKDPYTQGHSQRVAQYTVALAEALGLAGSDIARIQLAGQLHDVGKIGVADVLLTKPGSLTPPEYAAIQQHPVIGERMLAAVPFLKEILPSVRHHHEHWDGRGYPDGLRAHQIPEDAAILAVADAFDAMTSDRPYRCALPLAEARRRILEGSGTQFDPRVVRAFEQALAAGTVSVPSSSWTGRVGEVAEQAS